MNFERIYIWGHNPFNNQMLAHHVESYSSVKPICISSPSELTGTFLGEKKVLFFCDCDKVEAIYYCKELYRRLFVNNVEISLMNVDPKQKLLGEIMKYPICGIFYSSDDFDLFGKGIQKVLGGEYWMSRSILTQSLCITRNAQINDRSMTSAELTLREHEILRLIALGLDNQAIADQLFISPNTVKTHISNIYKKIEVTNRVQAIIWATEHLVGHFHLSGNSDHDCAASGSMLECGNHGMINLLGKLTQ